MNKPLLAALILIPLTAALAGVESPASPNPVKKGAAGQAKEANQALQESGVSWLYNWHPTPGTTLPEGIEFVPMIWGKRDVAAIEQAQGKVLLGFNEPERKEQANMTVEEALEIWPKMEATKMRLGSPAPAGGATRPGGWFDRFMTTAQERGYRVDFICLHWYGSNYKPDAAVKALKNYLTSIYERYQKPIWLTEFSISQFKNGPEATVAEQQAFMEKALPMLDSLPFVERYSWFVFNSNKKGKPQNWYLLNSENELNELGKTYSTASQVKN